MRSREPKRRRRSTRDLVTLRISKHAHFFQQGVSFYKLAQHTAQPGSFGVITIALEPFIYSLSRSVFLKAAIAIVKGLEENSHFH